MAFPLQAGTLIRPDLLALETNSRSNAADDQSFPQGQVLYLTQDARSAALPCVQSEQVLSVRRILTAVLIISRVFLLVNSQ